MKALMKTKEMTWCFTNYDPGDVDEFVDLEKYKGWEFIIDDCGKVFGYANGCMVQIDDYTHLI